MHLSSCKLVRELGPGPRLDYTLLQFCGQIQIKTNARNECSEGGLSLANNRAQQKQGFLITLDEKVPASVYL